MFKKIIFLIFCLYSSLESTDIIYPLQQYGSDTRTGPNYYYLSLDGFKEGDNIYIKLSFNNGNSYRTIQLGYYESNDFSSDSLSYLKYFNSYSKSKSGKSFTFYFTIELTKSAKYLLLATPTFKDKLDTSVTITHTKSNFIATLLLIIFGAIFLALIITGIGVFLCLRKIRTRDNKIDYTKQTTPIQPLYQSPPDNIPPTQQTNQKYQLQPGYAQPVY